MVKGKLNLPANYINYVKSWPKFKTALLDFPKNGIIIHDTSLEIHLANLGISEKDFTTIRIGTSMPGSILLVAATENFPCFFIAEGLPGGSGVSTLSAELFSLGADNIIHIGLCGLMGDAPPSGIPILSQGSYKDSVADLLSSDEDTQALAFPSGHLNSVVSQMFKEGGQPLHLAFGYTTPLFYFQSVKLIIDLVTGHLKPEKKRISYIEMEQAALFQTAKIMGKNAASIVVGSDRYSIKNGSLDHNFESDFDQDALEQVVLNHALRALAKLT